MREVYDLANVKTHGRSSCQGDEGFKVPLFRSKPCLGGPEKTGDRA
jgi:hypothetical protein